MTDAPRDWFGIAPIDAIDLVLPAEGVVGPVNEEGEPCPWPWEPQQRGGQGIGMYRCGYCGAMVIAGLPHPDYAEQFAAGRSDEAA